MIDAKPAMVNERSSKRRPLWSVVFLDRVKQSHPEKFHAMNTAGLGNGSQEAAKVQKFEGQLQVQCKVELTVVMAWAVSVVALMEQGTLVA